MRLQHCRCSNRLYHAADQIEDTAVRIADLQAEPASRALHAAIQLKDFADAMRASCPTRQAGKCERRTA